MKLRNIQFGSVLGASGVQGWFGEGYPYHRYLKHVGLDFTGMTLVSKTTTLYERKGNMLVEDDGITPSELRPKCIHITPRTWMRGVALNAVGLTGPGMHALLNMLRWQELTAPFFLSFMSVAPDAQQRSHELRLYCELLKHYQPGFRSKFGLQINFSCPNAGVDPTALIGEVGASLQVARNILGDVPLMPKFNALVPPVAVRQMQGYCDAVCISNTIPWGKLPDKINWRGHFGKKSDGSLVQSPLAEFGGGGLSGAPLLPIVADWVREAKDIGLSIPINAGGGILSADDVDRLVSAGLDLLGHDSIFLGSVAFLRPWRVQKIIRRAFRHSEILGRGA